MFRRRCTCPFPCGTERRHGRRLGSEAVFRFRPPRLRCASPAPPCRRGAGAHARGDLYSPTPLARQGALSGPTPLARQGALSGPTPLARQGWPSALCRLAPAQPLAVGEAQTKPPGGAAGGSCCSRDAPARPGLGRRCHPDAGHARRLCRSRMRVTGKDPEEQRSLATVAESPPHTPDSFTGQQDKGGPGRTYHGAVVRFASETDADKDTAPNTITRGRDKGANPCPIVASPGRHRRDFPPAASCARL